MKIVLFEDEFVENLSPLTLTRPVYGLRCGPDLLYEKVLRAFPDADVYLFMRKMIAKAFIARMALKEKVKGFNDIAALKGDNVLLINGRWIIDKSLISEDEGLTVSSDGAVIYTYLKRNAVEKAVQNSASIREFLEWSRRELSEKKVDGARLIKYPWDLVYLNSEEIRRGVASLRCANGEFPENFKGLEVIGEKEDLFIARGAKIYPNVVLDTTNGPIIIDERAVIYPFTVIYGPSYIGKDSRIIGAKIREGTTIGPVCRVGGEVEESIIHGYTNKYHDGFLGHSYVGEWVNLGALTTTSDLKNTYRPVKVYVNGKQIETRKLKVGSFIGDHTKMGIATFLNTGTSVGVMCNIASSGMILPKYIPSFVWYVGGRMSAGPGLKYMLDTAKIAMSRRGVQLLDVEVKLFQELYEKTEKERENAIKMQNSHLFEVPPQSALLMRGPRQTEVI